MARKSEAHDVSNAPWTSVQSGKSPREWSVDTANYATEEMHTKFVVVDDLRMGTDKMREKAGTYIPRETAELDSSWRDRVSRSFLFQAYDKAVSRLSARPFNDRIKLSEGSPQSIVDFSKDVDGAGRSLTDFAHDLFENGIHHGIAGVLVEFTDTVGAETMRDTLDARPVWEMVDFNRVVGFRLGSRGSKTVLTQLRIYTQAMVDVGAFGEMMVHQIKVYARDEEDNVTWEMWSREEAQDEFVPTDGGSLTLDYIPFEPFYTNRVGFLVGEPALQALAEKNLEHFQSSSDQRNILHFVRSAILFRKGFKEDEVKKRVAIGPSRMHSTTSDKADMKYVEHSGKGIDSGQKDIEHIEDQMQVLGLEPLMRTKPGTRTATEKALEFAEESSDMKSWVRVLEDVLDRALNITAEWLNEAYESEVDINDQFTMLQEGDIVQLIMLWKEHGLTSESLLEALKTRGYFDEGFDVAAEVDKLREERKNDLSLLPMPSAPFPAPDKTNGPGIV